MQNTLEQNPGFWDRFAGWTQTAARWNTGWARRSATAALFVTALALAMVVQADTTDYDVTAVSINSIPLPAVVHTDDNCVAPDCKYGYVLNTGGATVESGLNTSIKLTDGGGVSYPSAGFDGLLPGDLLPGDVVDVEMEMAAIQQAEGAPDYDYPVTVEMWVLSEPISQYLHQPGDGNPTWVGLTPSSVEYNAVLDCEFSGGTNTTGSGCDSMKVTITIPALGSGGAGLEKSATFGHVTWDGDDLPCNAGSALGPTSATDATPDINNPGWYDAGPGSLDYAVDEEGNLIPVGDYCYKVKVQARSDDPKFGNGSGMVIYFNIDPPGGSHCSDDFGGFLSPIQGTAGNWYRKVNNANAGTSVKFQMYYSGGGLLSDVDAALLVNGNDTDDCELIMRWAHDGSEVAPTGSPATTSGDAVRQGTPTTTTTTFIYDDVADQFVFPLNIGGPPTGGSGMVNGHDYTLTVYERHNVDILLVEDASGNDAVFTLHVAHQLAHP